MVGPYTARRASVLHRLRAAGAAALGALALGACVSAETIPAGANAQGYACCNLHYDGDWISDVNYGSLPMIAAGTPITVLSYGRDRAHVLIAGQPFRLGHDYGRAEESTPRWVSKLVVPTDPTSALATFPADVQDAIRAGRVMRGMTREQVIMAVGHPLTSENPRLDAPLWRLWWTRAEEYRIEWNDQGLVARITGSPETLRMVVHKP